jgi:hypothetical protein
MFYVNGKMPDQVDHINRIKTDNRIANLRDVTCLENARNMPVSKKNTTGVVGVKLDRQRSKWIAYIYVNKKCVHLGTFDSISDAKEARRKAQESYGFHENHGKTLSSDRKSGRIAGM